MAWFSVLLSSSVLAMAAERQKLHGTVPAAVRNLRPLQRLAGTNRMDVVFVLPLRNRDALTNLLDRLYDPVSPDYHQYLTPAQFAERFGPTLQDYEVVIAFAKAQGMRITGKHPNRTLVNVNASVTELERVLHIKMQVYQHPTEARTFHAPDTEPSLDLAVPILDVGGLDDIEPPQPASRGGFSFRRNSAVLPNAAPLIAGTGPRGYLLGRDFRTTYAPGVRLEGEGQVVGLLQFDGYYTSDVLAYEHLAGLPNVPLTNVLVNGFSGQPGFWNIEVSLDIQMAIAMAPGLAGVIVYEASPATSPYDLLNRMATDTNSLGKPAAMQLSSSWSWPGRSTVGQAQVFLQFAVQGQSFFQASGDNGAWCRTCPMPAPMDEPYLTCVGGTVLTARDPSGGWASEDTWTLFPAEPVGTGGGVSTNFSIPLWQQGVDMSRNGGSTTMRNIPDVACVADGIWVIVNNGEQGVVAGTSASAPLWAGFAALVNQQAAASGKPSIGFLNPAIYSIGKSSTYAAAFHDIVTGNNTNTCCGTDKFPAVPGYDLCTGWGTPTGSNLIAALLAPPPALRITPAAPLTFTGPMGGPFRPAASTFMLTNDSNASISWTVTNPASWLDVWPVAGQLTNGGPAATVTVLPSPSMYALPIGSYSATLWFTNVNTTNWNDRFGQSRQVNLDVVAPPVILAQPANHSVYEGMTANFSVTVLNSASCSYQWQFDNGHAVIDLVDADNVSGSRSSTLIISNAAIADEGAYSVIVSNGGGSVSSAPAFLAVFPWRPVILVPPTNQTALAGQAITFTVVAVGTQPLYYTWQRNGSALTDGSNVSGAASSSLTLRSASPADAGTYSVVVGNADGVAISTGALLSVTAITPPDATLSVVYSFSGTSDGGNPNALLRAANGSFYGTTQNGGTNGAGTVFWLGADGALETLYSFSGGADGATPFGVLASGPDGNLYGTTFQGGADDNGTIFRITPSGELSNLFAFDIAIGDLPYAGLTLGADGYFYGTCYQGGAGGRGTVFRTSTGGALNTLCSFTDGLEGGHVAAGLVQGADDSVYGTAFKGGLYGFGTVFRVETNGTLSTLAAFDRTNGAYPLAGLVRDASGVLYGATTSGGALSNGTVFCITPAGALTTLYSFSGGRDGSYPAASLLQGSDGNFYGTTALGGDYADGTLFRITPGGTLTTLVVFDGFAGANPQAALAEDVDGSLVGATQNGGAQASGVVFRLSFGGPLQITAQPVSQAVYVGQSALLSVAVAGSAPLTYQWRRNGIDLSDGGNISGATSRVLRLTSVVTSNAGTYSVRVSNPAGSTNSALAVLQVISSPPVIVTGPTNQSPDPCATVYLSVKAVGNQPLFYQWRRNGLNLTNSCNVAGYSSSALVLNSVSEADNGFYTVIVSNAVGQSNATALVNVVPKSATCTSLATRHWFTGGTDGRIPSGLAQGTNGILYGSTYWGGNHLSGAIYSLTTNGIFSILVSFSGANGANPTAAPVQGADGRFYGTTSGGGANGAGSVFAMTVDGVLTTIYSFNGEADGGYPMGRLVQGSDGNFYGTTSAGGPADLGTVFRVTAAGDFTNLYFFSGDGGGSPTAGLVQGCDGAFYGLTPEGGAHQNGTVFRITPSGRFTLLYSFTGGADGYQPVGELVSGSDCNLYGATKYSTLNGFQFYGTVFRITPNGVLNTLHTFGDFLLNDGLYPYAGLLQSMDGNLYGTTYSDRRGENGTLYRLAPDGGSFATLVYFDGCDVGAQPQAPLAEDSEGNLYGTTTAGGPCPTGRGALYRLSVGCAPQITSPPASQAAVAGTDVALSVASVGARPFSYQWRKNGTNLIDGGSIAGASTRLLKLASVSLADSGTYSVVVSNSIASVTSAGAHLTVVYPPMFVSVVRSNCALQLAWSTMPNQRYRLQYKNLLLDTNWTSLGGLVSATGVVLRATDNVCTNTGRFYRAVLIPQVQ